VSQATDTRQATTLAALLRSAVESGSGPAMRFFRDGQWRRLSYPQVYERAHELARGLIALGIEPGDRVAILSVTRPEWTLADLAILWAGAIGVPIYHTNSPHECEHVLRDSGARAIFCEDPEQVAKVAPLRERLEGFEHVIAFTGESEGTLSLDELVARGGEVGDGEIERRLAAVKGSDPATIVYTSGTTGAPKGCVLTHDNLRSNLEMAVARLELAGGPKKTFYLWLPLAHVLARVVQYVGLHIGAEIAYWRGDPKLLLEDIQEIEPTHLPSVPRVFEKIYNRALAGVEDSPLRKRIFEWGLEIGRRWMIARERGQRVPPGVAALYPLADKLVLSKIRSLFGSRLEWAVTGAAPVEAEILEFFHAAGVYVLEGYGMTEASAVVTVNTIPEHRFGSVGKPLPGTEVRLGEDGELQVRGPQVFAGYWGHEDASREAVPDGWLRTGDLAHIDEDGYVYITGRKKEIIITSSGKNVTPASIENALTQTRWIANAVVYGDRRPYITALVTLDPTEIDALAEKLGVPADPAAMARDARVREEIGRVIDEVNQRFARIEQVKRFFILERDLTQEEGELTPTGKVKRNVVYERYAQRFAEVYEG